MITTVTLNASIDKAYTMAEPIENGTVMRVKEVSNTAGGKGLNVARVVHLCGSDVSATGFAGGFNGKYLEAMLDDDGIAHHFAHVKGETRSCINILDPKYSSTEYLEPGCSISDEEQKNFLEKVFPEAIAACDVVTFSGSAPKGIAKDIYASLVAAAKKQGRKTILDTSGDYLRLGLAAKPDVIKPNQEELAALFQTEVESTEKAIDLAEKLHQDGIPYVVISLGGDGAVIVCDEGAYHGRSPAIKPVNTVGCGDSMVAALAVSLEKNSSPSEALRYAVSVASANALSPYTGNFDPAVQKKLYDSTTVTKIR
jgi:tagatose 6-phosphate kinase